MLLLIFILSYLNTFSLVYPSYKHYILIHRRTYLDIPPHSRSFLFLRVCGPSRPPGCVVVRLRGRGGGGRAGALAQRPRARAPPGGRRAPLRRAQEGAPPQVHPGQLHPAQDAGQGQLRQGSAEASPTGAVWSQDMVVHIRHKLGEEGNSLRHFERTQERCCTVLTS